MGNNLQNLVIALQAAKRRQRPAMAGKRKIDRRDMQTGLGTNENGPQVEAPSYPANAWSEDGDHS